MGKCSEKGNRNKRPFQAPARGREVNIYCLLFSQVQTILAIFFSKSLFSLLAPVNPESYHSKSPWRYSSAYHKQNKKARPIPTALGNPAARSSLPAPPSPLTPYLIGFLARGRTGPGVTVQLRRTGAVFIFLILFLIKIHAA